MSWASIPSTAPRRASSGVLEAVAALVQLHRRLQETTQRASPAVEFDENVEGVGTHLEDQFQLLDMPGVRSAGWPEPQLLDERARVALARVMLVLDLVQDKLEVLYSFEDGLLQGVGVDPDLVAVARVEGAGDIEPSLGVEVYAAEREGDVVWQVEGEGNRAVLLLRPRAGSLRRRC